MLKCFFEFFVGVEVDVEVEADADAEVEADNGGGENEAEIEITNGNKSELEDYENDIPTSVVDISVSEEPAIDNSTIHEGKNLYKCIFCNASFSNHISLKIHDKLLHEERKPHKCLICDYICYRSKNLKKHIDEVHDGNRITSIGHKDTNSTGKAHFALPIQKLDDFESPSVFETFTVLPTEPWLPVAMPTSLAQSPLNLPGFGPSTGSNNEAILGKVLRFLNSVSITFVIDILFVRLRMSTK